MPSPGVWVDLFFSFYSEILLQTCSKLLSEISEDKQLWSHILERDVKACSLGIPSNLRNIREVHAGDIESWVKHAILLKKAYKVPNNRLLSRKLDIRLGLRATWLKIILGQWCIVAAADDNECELSLWEANLYGGVRFATRIFLEAPVIDGLTDESNGEAKCAITVGTT